MRITNRTMNSNLLRNLNNGMSRMNKYNMQLATGKTVQVPSDDPVKAGAILRLRSSLRETEQYKRNTEEGLSWLDATDITLGETTKVIHRVQELAVYGANGTLDESSRLALAREVEQLMDNVLQLGNSTHGGRFLFSGQKTQTRPFSKVDGGGVLVPPIYEGDDGELVREIGGGAEMSLNLPGDRVFDPIFEVLANVHNNLVSGNTEELSQNTIGELDDALDQLVRHRAEIGAKHNRAELAYERLADLGLNLTQLLSKSEDVDVAETIMHLKFEENIYQTALSVGARIIQPSLVDFLR